MNTPYFRFVQGTFGTDIMIFLSNITTVGLRKPDPAASALTTGFHTSYSSEQQKKMHLLQNCFCFWGWFRDCFTFFYCTLIFWTFSIKIPRKTMLILGGKESTDYTAAMSLLFVIHCCFFLLFLNSLSFLFHHFSDFLDCRVHVLPVVTIKEIWNLLK